ncbi:hypothetical protein ABC795_09415 [Blastococcus sp. HT6-30]|uniref:hypothetical protein n=1 Tax=Blastococcus sp. HT6-30 TaxID=3144843 RepID=UPI00321A82AA
MQGSTLVAVPDFLRVLTYLPLDGGDTAAEPIAEVPTDPDRVRTTADVARGRLLLVESQFDEDPPSRSSEVVVLRFGPWRLGPTRRSISYRPPACALRQRSTRSVAG